MVNMPAKFDEEAMVNIPAKFDEEAHNGLVCTRFTAYFHVSTVTLTFDL